VFYCDICYYQCHAEYIFILPDRGGSVLHLAVDGKDRFTMREDNCTILVIVLFAAVCNGFTGEYRGE
jgi:hypothetical protein